MNILQTLVYGKTKAGIRIAAAGIAFVYEKWSAGIRMPAAGIAMPAAGIAIAYKNGAQAPHPVWDFKNLKG